jgi:hypothetical protein
MRCPGVDPCSAAIRRIRDLNPLSILYGRGSAHNQRNHTVSTDHLEVCGFLAALSSRMGTPCVSQSQERFYARIAPIIAPINSNARSQWPPSIIMSRQSRFPKLLLTSIVLNTKPSQQSAAMITPLRTVCSPK